jgi:putative transcription factor
MSKLENETEVLNHKTVDKSICKLIQQARLQKGMKQKDLANKLNIQVTVIQNIESGKSIEDKALINRIARTLGIQLKKK